MYKILVADDETKIRETIKDYFSAKGFDVFLAANGKEAVELSSSNAFDLIILDVMMPVMDGLNACKEIRKTSNIPVLFLSALGEENDFLNGYSSGADDYIVKPFPLSVLHEKCLAMIKRYKGIHNENKITISGIELDLNAHKAFINDTDISLSEKDFQLLKYLIDNKNIVLSRDLILNRIWGYDFFGDTRVVDTHIKIIRKTLGDKSKLVHTVINAGYVFKEEE
ncbi:MAG: response regulator transcription factor [Eubacterium sp.]|nr:response regulator transcription factor [Eubacterium sp.]